MLFKYKTVKLVLIGIFTFIYSSIFSQQCDGVLMPDVTIRNNEIAWRQTIVNVFQSNHIETYEDFRNFMGKANIVYSGIPMGGSSNVTDKEFKEFKEYLYKYASIDAENKSKINETMRALSQAAIDAWTKCKTQFGFHVWVLQGQDPSSFTLAASYRGRGTVHLRNVSFSQSVKTNDGPFTNQNAQTNVSQVWGSDMALFQSFTRLTNDAIDIEVNPLENSVGGGLHIQLNPVPGVFSECTISGNTNETPSQNPSIGITNTKNKNVYLKIEEIVRLVPISGGTNGCSIRLTITNLRTNETTNLTGGWRRYWNIAAETTDKIIADFPLEKGESYRIETYVDNGSSGTIMPRFFTKFNWCY